MAGGCWGLGGKVDVRDRRDAGRESAGVWCGGGRLQASGLPEDLTGIVLQSANSSEEPQGLWDMLALSPVN